LFYISTDGVTQGKQIGSRLIPPLGGGTASSGSTNIAASLPAGTYYVIACADGTARVPETNESNNCSASLSFSIPGPDLTVSSVTVPSTAGATIDVTAVVSNLGSPAGGSGNYYYLSTDGVTMGLKLGSSLVKPVIFGAPFTATATLTLPAYLSVTANYFIIACADATNIVAETNETNNCTASNAFTSLGADLVETSVSVPPTASGSISLTETLANNGASLAGSSATYFYLSPDGVTQGQNLGHRVVGPLAPGAASTATTTLSLPVSLTGTAYVIACADVGNHVPESNETNDCTSSNAFTVSGP
jgi:subtilase family serine protease